MTDAPEALARELERLPVDAPFKSDDTMERDETHQQVTVSLDLRDRILAALTERKAPVEVEGLVERDDPVIVGLRERIDEVVEFNGVGFWRSCSGCHETNEGVETGPYSPVLRCHLGMGCGECGGIGAVWDSTDYEDMARWMLEEDAAEQSAATELATLKQQLAEREEAIRLAVEVMTLLVAGYAKTGPFDEPLGSSEQSPAINAASAFLRLYAARALTDKGPEQKGSGGGVG